MVYNIDVRGLFSDCTIAALFEENVEPLVAEIEDAQRFAEDLSSGISKLIEKVGGIDPGWYAREQPMFGPLVRMMALAGWTLSGSGFFSVAFYKGGLAIKIGLKPEQDAALSFLNHVRDMQEPCLPTLYALGQADEHYVVVMERYDPIECELDDESVLYDPQIAAEFDEIKQAIRTGKAGHFASSKVAAALHERFKDEAYFDVNSNNVMLSRDGQLVITDPLGCTSYSYD